jgi:hypothetical protein
MNTNDQHKFESSVGEKQYFSSSVLFIEIGNIFEKLMEGSDYVIVLKVRENSESQLVLDGESENENDRERGRRERNDSQ